MTQGSTLFGALLVHQLGREPPLALLKQEKHQPTTVALSACPAPTKVGRTAQLVSGPTSAELCTIPAPNAAR